MRSNNGVEFQMPFFFYQSKGVTHQLTCFVTSLQNSIVERKHQYILNMARALNIQSRLTNKYSTNFVIIAVYLINRTPTPILQHKSPFKILYKTEPSYSHLRVFGCLCFVSTLSYAQTKFGTRARRFFFFQDIHMKLKDTSYLILRLTKFLSLVLSHSMKKYFSINYPNMTLGHPSLMQIMHPLKKCFCYSAIPPSLLQIITFKQSQKQTNQTSPYNHITHPISHHHKLRINLYEDLCINEEHPNIFGISTTSKPQHRRPSSHHLKERLLNLLLDHQR